MKSRKESSFQTHVQPTCPRHLLSLADFWIEVCLQAHVARTRTTLQETRSEWRRQGFLLVVLPPLQEWRRQGGDHLQGEA